jgi:hypothetical protein
MVGLCTRHPLLIRCPVPELHKTGTAIIQVGEDGTVRGIADAVEIL